MGIDAFVTRGPDDLREALARIGNTPMRRLTMVVDRTPRAVYLKLEAMNPAGSLKDRTALALMQDLEARQLLQPDSIVTESTSGNMGVALALVCRALGYPFTAVVDPKAPADCLRRMQVLGAVIDTVERCDEHGNYLLARLDRVRELCAHDARYVWADQYTNPANPRAHYEGTAPEIYRQMGGKVDAVFVAVGTGGTLAGIGRWFRERSPRTLVIAVDARGSRVFGDAPAPRRLTGIGSARASNFITPDLYDGHLLVSDVDAIAFCRQLYDATGLMVGGSTGAVLVACARYLQARRALPRAVAVCADAGESYAASIFDDAWLRRQGVRLDAAERSPVDHFALARPGAELRRGPASRRRAIKMPAVSPGATGSSAPDAGDILYLSGDDVRRASCGVDFVAEVREVLRLHASGQTLLPDEAYLAWKTGRGEPARSLNMPGYVGGSFDLAGTKIINSNPCNPTAGIPRASGLTLLFDHTSARIVCVMEAAYISSMRTAAVTAIGADLLGAMPISSLALLGAGVLARAHLELLVPRLPQLATIRVYDLVRDRAAALAASAASTGGVPLQVTDTPEEAVRGSQLVVPVTTTTTAYIPYRWLAPGTLVVNVSLDDVEEDVVLRAARVVVDDWTLVKNDQRRLLGRMYHSGTLRAPDDMRPLPSGTARVHSSLGDLVCGRAKGRAHPDEIILLNPFGLAIEDLAIAVRVYERARELRLGTLLPR